MLEVFLLLTVCWGIAALLPKTANGWNSIKSDKENLKYKLVYFVLIAILVCFAGLRTVMNDTGNYLHSFNNVSSSLSAIKSIDLSLGANPGFESYRIILRSLGFSDGSLFLFITAIFVSTSYITFLRKYSEDFSLSVYLLIASTTYAFTLAAIKQTVAIGIGIWAIDALIKKKKIIFILLSLLACTFHPYILIYLVAPIFLNKLWSSQTVLSVLVVIALGSVFGPLVESLISVTESIGDQYDPTFFYGSGVSVFRLLFYMITPILSFLFREKLRKRNDQIVNIFVNLSIVSMCFMILASFGGANMFGRMANYFDIFNCLSFPIVLYCGGFSKSEINIVKPIAMLSYTFFYYTYYAKYHTAWNADYYQHISLLELFKKLIGG